MSKHLLLLPIFYISFAFGQPQEPPLDLPGTLELEKNFYVDKTPVTNKMFLEYLTAKHFLRKNGFNSFKQYEETLDDTLTGLRSVYPSFLLNLKGVYGKDFKAEYVEDYKYKDHPVLGVSREQAADFCKWRTEMVSYLWRTNAAHIRKKPYAHLIKYRLPLPEELDLAKEYFSDQKKLLMVKGKDPLKFNTTANPEALTFFKISEYTRAQETYGENYRGIQPVSFPNEVTGFRCVCEVVAEGRPNEK